MLQTEQLCKEIAERSLQAFRMGLFSGTSGNLSVYLRDRDIMLITPTSVRYETLKPSEIVQMKLDGTLLNGEKRPSSEWQMHAVIYEHFPEINAVFHTHSPYATAFAVNRQTIPAVLIEAHMFLGGDIRCADYAMPGTREVGISAVPALRGRGGCTLANHGVLAVGADLDQAFLRAEYMEDLAKIYFLAKQIGAPVVLPHL